MTKDVLLSIKGLQIGENEQNDTIEVISPGDYYFRNGKHFFMYEEVMEGQKESTRNMIKVRDNYMELTKKGAVNVHMIFEKIKRILHTTIHRTAVCWWELMPTVWMCRRKRKRLRLRWNMRWR